MPLAKTHLGTQFKRDMTCIQILHTFKDPFWKLQFQNLPDNHRESESSMRLVIKLRVISK